MLKNLQRPLKKIFAEAQKAQLAARVAAQEARLEARAKEMAKDMVAEMAKINLLNILSLLPPSTSELTFKLIEDHRLEDLNLMLKDSNYQNQLFEEYHLNNEQ